MSRNKQAIWLTAALAGGVPSSHAHAATGTDTFTSGACAATVTMRVAAGLLPFGTLPGAALATGAALAQSMAPMRDEVVSVSDAFAVRVFPSNPHNRPIRVEVHVYDQDFARVSNARISVSPTILGSNASRPVSVAVPFEGRPERKVRICTESIPFPNSQI